jgi:hypothetical protein
MRWRQKIEPSDNEIGEWDVVTAWNKEQAKLLRRIALAGGSCEEDKCRGPALDGLIEAGFATVQTAGHAALTKTGLARARELRLGNRHNLRHSR